jgi:murein DD-endopeptidase MepM/ murein hydrolase activator NlpD
VATEIKIKASFRKKILINDSQQAVVGTSSGTKGHLSLAEKTSNGQEGASKSQQTTENEISSSFGRRIDPINNSVKFHNGIDISRPTGTKVFAWSDGIVTRNGWLRGYGVTVDVTHSDGVKTRYAHLKRTNVRKGQKIDKGQILGQVGETGRTTGSNLHFEVAVAGKRSNPLDHLSEDGKIVGNSIVTKNG